VIALEHLRSITYNPPVARKVLITEKEAGKTVIDWLCTRFTYQGELQWKEHLSEGRLKVNDSHAETGQILSEGDNILFTPPPRPEPPWNPDYQTIYEDDNVLILNKPADLTCHPGGIYLKHTLWWLLKEKNEHISLVSRLDRETSGLMTVALTKMTAGYYFKVMQNRQAKKEYLALVEGSFPLEMDARGWLRKDTNSIIRKKKHFHTDSAATEEQQNTETGEFAHTTFRLLGEYEGTSLVRCRLHTGKTHQIRATLFSLEFPLVGDKMYGPDEGCFLRFAADELTQKDNELLKLPHQALHSWQLTLPFSDGTKKTFRAAPPSEWNEVYPLKKIMKCLQN